MKLQDFTDNPKRRLIETVRILRKHGELVPDFENMTIHSANAEIGMLREYLDTKLTDPVDRQRISVVIESIELWKKVARNDRARRRLWEEITTGNIESTKCIIAAEDVKEEFMGMLEAISKIQATKILNIVNGMKAEEEFSTDTANEFSETVKNLVKTLEDSVTQTIDQFDDAIMKARGKDTGSDMEGDGGLGSPEDGPMDMEGGPDGGLEGIGEPGDDGPGDEPGAAVGGLGDGIGDDGDDGISDGLDGMEGGGRPMKDEA